MTDETNTQRRQLLQASLAAAMTTALGKAGLAATGGKRELPNILWYVSEDNNPLIGAYGDKLARTPTIDKMAAKGILYRNVYSTAPVCGPSRFSILTGLHAWTAGSSENMGPTSETLPSYIVPYPTSLRDAGYYTTNNNKKNYCSQFEWLPIWDESSNDAHWRKRPAGKPFMSVFNNYTTHESSLFRHIDGAVKPEQVTVPGFLPDTPGVRKDLANYYNAMEKMDGEFAAMLAELEKDGLSDDTIVFYYSDNGGIMPRGKRYLFDEGLRVSMVVYLPPKWQHLTTHKPGTVIDNPVTLMDLVPTLLSLAGQKPPAYLHGQALLGEYAAKAPKKYAFGGRNRMDERYDLARTMTDGRYRYTRNYSPHRIYNQHVSFMFQAASYQDWEVAHRAGKLNKEQDACWNEKPYEELYDLQSDPRSLRNRIDDPLLAAKAVEMRKAMDEHQIAVNDNGFIPEGTLLKDFVASRRPGAYPLKRVMALAESACRRQASNIPTLVAALKDENEVIRYWGAQGLLMLGQAAKPALADIHAAANREQSVPTRISLYEALIKLDNDREALRGLGNIVDQDSNGAFRLQAINALDYVGERARPVMGSIRRAAKEDHRDVRNVGEYLVDVLDGKYDPSKQPFRKGGGNVADPFSEDWDYSNARPYD